MRHIFFNYKIKNVYFIISFIIKKKLRYENIFLKSIKSTLTTKTVINYCKLLWFKGKSISMNILK